MKLESIYKKAVQIGINNDLRDKQEIQKRLKAEKEKFKDFNKKDKEFFDTDRLFNPYSDTRILNGDINAQIKKVIVGIDMEVGEILLTYLLNQKMNNKIDLIISHHPEGYALSQLYDVMKLQADLLANCGINISVAEQLLEKRISEVERKLLPANHSRSVDVAKILGIPLMCIHTPADNCVASYLTKLFKNKNPYNLSELIKILKDIPEYKNQSKLQIQPKILSGSENNKCGEIFVDMTGGTSGSKDIFDRLANTNISTLVGMHINEDHLEKAKKANLNIVIAGHIASDTLGLNLLFDQLEKEEKLEFVEVSGFKRIRRNS
ncbi:MAG: NGG1p interacting factor NIF3 [Candidatus Aminicenantaceae bacterium]